MSKNNNPENKKFNNKETVDNKKSSINSNNNTHKNPDIDFELEILDPIADNNLQELNAFANIESCSSLVNNIMLIKINESKLPIELLNTVGKELSFTSKYISDLISVGQIRINPVKSLIKSIIYKNNSKINNKLNVEHLIIADNIKQEEKEICSINQKILIIQTNIDLLLKKLKLNENNNNNNNTTNEDNYKLSILQIKEINNKIKEYKNDMNILNERLSFLKKNVVNIKQKLKAERKKEALLINPKIEKLDENININNNNKSSNESIYKNIINKQLFKKIYLNNFNEETNKIQEKLKQWKKISKKAKIIAKERNKKHNKDLEEFKITEIEKVNKIINERNKRITEERQRISEKWKKNHEDIINMNIPIMKYKKHLYIEKEKNFIDKQNKEKEKIIKNLMNFKKTNKKANVPTLEELKYFKEDVDNKKKTCLENIISKTEDYKRKVYGDDYLQERNLNSNNNKYQYNKTYNLYIKDKQDKNYKDLNAKKLKKQNLIKRKNYNKKFRIKKRNKIEKIKNLANKKIEKKKLKNKKYLIKKTNLLDKSILSSINRSKNIALLLNNLKNCSNINNCKYSNINNTVVKTETNLLGITKIEKNKFEESSNFIHSKNSFVNSISKKISKQQQELFPLNNINNVNQYNLNSKKTNNSCIKTNENNKKRTIKLNDYYVNNINNYKNIHEQLSMLDNKRNIITKYYQGTFPKIKAYPVRSKIDKRTPLQEYPNYLNNFKKTKDKSNSLFLSLSIKSNKKSNIINNNNNNNNKKISHSINKSFGNKSIDKLSLSSYANKDPNNYNNYLIKYNYHKNKIKVFKDAIDNKKKLYNLNKFNENEKIKAGVELSNYLKRDIKNKLELIEHFNNKVN